MHSTMKTTIMLTIRYAIVKFMQNSRVQMLVLILFYDIDTPRASIL
jgi:hypothetical protein